jgi:hypothetical protein
LAFTVSITHQAIGITKITPFSSFVVTTISVTYEPPFAPWFSWSLEFAFQFTLTFKFIRPFSSFQVILLSLLFTLS